MPRRRKQTFGRPEIKFYQLRNFFSNQVSGRDGPGSEAAMSWLQGWLGPGSIIWLSTRRTQPGRGVDLCAGLLSVVRWWRRRRRPSTQYDELPKFQQTTWEGWTAFWRGLSTRCAYTVSIRTAGAHLPCVDFCTNREAGREATQRQWVPNQYH